MRKIIFILSVFICVFFVGCERNYYTVENDYHVYGRELDSMHYSDSVYVYDTVRVTDSLYVIDTLINITNVIGDDTLIVELNNNMSYIEDIVDSCWRRFERFDWTIYDSLLEILSDDRYVVVPMKNFSTTNYDDKIVVGMRHDIDFNPFNALELARLEAEHGVSSTYYILQTANYCGEISSNKLVYFNELTSIWQEMLYLGHEIGDHNDYITMMAYYDIDIKNMLTWWHSYLQFSGIPVYGSASHGASSEYFNGSIFSDYYDFEVIEVNGKEIPTGFLTMEECGYEYEAYYVGYDRSNYFSDAGGHWREANGNPIDHLHEIPLGEKVVILTHPCWWSF